MFNRRHYEFVANTIKEARQEVGGIPNEREANAAGNALTNLAWRFADKFKADCETFDADHFFNQTVDGVVRRPRVKATENDIKNLSNG